MAQKLVQTQTQKLQQQQKLTQQQVMLIRMLEMPLTELEQNIQTEIDDNPALEAAPSDNSLDEREERETDSRNALEQDDEQGDSFEERTEREERESALDDALQRFGSDDQMPEPYQATQNYRDSADYEEIAYGNPVSFYDRLKEQMGEQELTDEQMQIMEYLIGSLDNDGLLRKDTDTIADELAIYHNLDIDKGKIDDVLAILQEFDPPGIGARSLRECLLLQVDRKQWTEERGIVHEVLANHYDDFINKRWQRIRQQMNITEEQMQAAQTELLKLNPKPGASLGETEGRNIQQITPDFIVDTADDGTVTFSVCKGRVPDLYVSESFIDLIQQYKRREERGERNDVRGERREERGEKREKLSRSEKEALVYAKEKVERAQGFIEAVKQRRRTLYITMKAIVEIQHKYFQDGDESDLQPMILKDVADRTGLDISTISRVSNMKYAQTRWGTFKLRHFFSDSYRTESGEEMSTRRIKAALQEIVEAEEKKHPLNDDALKVELTKRGFPIARRTISKYREQLGIPVARLRKN